MSIDLLMDVMTNPHWKEPKRPKQWCKHISYRCTNNSFKKQWWLRQDCDDDINVPKSWKCCPICETDRPR